MNLYKAGLLDFADRVDVYIVTADSNNSATQRMESFVASTNETSRKRGWGQQYQKVQFVEYWSNPDNLHNPQYISSYD